MLTGMSSEHDSEADYEILTTEGLERSENCNFVNMSDPLQVKAVLQKEGGLADGGSSPEIRRFSVNGVTYDSLLARVRTAFNTEKLRHDLFWKDEDGDLVQFSTTEELHYAMQHMDGNTLRIFIKVTPCHAQEESMATDSLYPNLEDEESIPMCKETRVPSPGPEGPQGAKPSRQVTFETPLSGSQPPDSHGRHGPAGHPNLHFHPWQWKMGPCHPFMAPGLRWGRSRKLLKKMKCIPKMMARRSNENSEEFFTVRQQVPFEFRSWVREYTRTWFMQGADTANETDTLPANTPRHFKKWLNDFLRHWSQMNGASDSDWKNQMDDNDVEEGVEAAEGGVGNMLAAPDGLPPLYYQWLCLFLPRFYQNEIKNNTWSMEGQESYGPHCAAGPWRFHGHGKGHHHGWKWHHWKRGCRGGKKAWKKRGCQSSSGSESEDSDGGKKMWKNIPKEFRRYVRISVKKLHKKKGDTFKARERATQAGVTPEVMDFVQQILLEWHAKLSQKRPQVVAADMMDAQRTLPSGLTREHFLWMCRFMARWHRRHAGKCDFMSGWSSGETDDDTRSGEEGCASSSHDDRHHFQAMNRSMRHFHHHPHGMMGQMGPMGHPPPPFAMQPGMEHHHCPPPPPYGCIPPPPPHFLHFPPGVGMMSGPGFSMSCGVNPPEYSAHGCAGPHQEAWTGDNSASGCHYEDSQAGQAKTSHDDMVDHVTEGMKKI